MKVILRLLLCLLLLPAAASAKPLVADISSHDVTIHTSFNGADLILFGARNDPGDIVIVVRGPEKRAIVRRKEKKNGIWMNRTKEKFNHIPSFYALATSRPLEEIRQSIYFSALGITDTSLFNTPRFVGLAEKPSTRRQEFERALLRYLRSENLYSTEAGTVDFIGETLFKTRFRLPDNTPRGHYTAEVFLFTDGQITGMHTTPLHVFKTGADAFIYDMAHHYKYLYGILCISVALFFGWGASRVFQRI